MLLFIGLLLRMANDFDNKQSHLRVLTPGASAAKAHHWEELLRHFLAESHDSPRKRPTGMIPTLTDEKKNQQPRVGPTALPTAPYLCKA